MRQETVKRALLTVLTAALVIIVVGTVASCGSDDSPPQYEGEPISITGSLRWGEEWGVFLDIEVTNNTNKGINSLGFERASSVIITNSLNDLGWQDMPLSKANLDWAGKWFEKLLKGPPIKAYGSKKYSLLVTSAIYRNQDGPDTYATAVRCNFAILEIEFDGYGIFVLDNPIEIECESYR
ncbi:MAG: hypothetical protein FWF18_01315 [Dehalococcoidia bacterium]|nr:hypothetical protein [Dehalococcoidia bacterium]